MQEVEKGLDASNSCKRSADNSSIQAGGEPNLYDNGRPRLFRYYHPKATKSASKLDPHIVQFLLVNALCS